jgi:hypothetical protein
MILLKDFPSYGEESCELEITVLDTWDNCVPAPVQSSAGSASAEVSNG